MPSLIMSFESSLQLQVLVLVCGLASFWAALSCGSNPLCTWLEWIDGHHADESID